MSAQQVTYETLDEGRIENTHRWFGARAGRRWTNLLMVAADEL